MVLKPYVDSEERDPRRSAGRRAERQMAHYLDRHFGDATNVLLLHDLRIELGGEVAQMDHLVVHSFGVAIVESKSVTTEVRINAAGEWERWWDRRWQGMRDPILQGERQGMLLKKLLTSRQAELLDKAVFGLLQGNFKNMALDVFAAISDQGRISRAEKGQAPRVLKADAVPNAIQDVIAGYRHATGTFSGTIREAREAPRVFKDDEVLRIGHFLRTRHVVVREGVAPSEPVLPARVDTATRRPGAGRQRDAAPTPAGATPPPAPPDPPVAAADAGDGDVVLVVCRACGGSDLEARIGKLGPYGRCRACGTNTPVRMRCAGCGESVRVERAPGGFAGVCGACGRGVSVRVGG